MSAPLTPDVRESLLTSARAAAQHSYSPYSHFRVGAAVLTTRGIFTGTNVENASYGLCLCAERAALATAISAGANDVRAIAVSCIDARKDVAPAELMPCGACRQWMCELAPAAEVIVDGLERSFTTNDLLPGAFTLERKGATS